MTEKLTERRRRAPRAPKPLRQVECGGCGCVFETKERAAKYCSQDCYHEHGNHKGCSHHCLICGTWIDANATIRGTSFEMCSKPECRIWISAMQQVRSRANSKARRLRKQEKNPWLTKLVRMCNGNRNRYARKHHDEQSKRTRIAVNWEQAAKVIRLRWKEEGLRAAYDPWVKKMRSMAAGTKRRALYEVS